MTFRRRSTVSSFIWTLWLRMPQKLRMFIYRCGISVGKPTSSYKVTCLPFGLYAKVGIDSNVMEELFGADLVSMNTSIHIPKKHTGTDSNIMEGLATHFVSMNTSIPVPTILDIAKDHNGTLFLMTRVPGTPVSDIDGGLNVASPEQLSVFTNTMRDWFTQLQSLRPPGDGSICGLLGGDFWSYRITFNYRVGPFESQDIFHEKMFCTLPPDADSAIVVLAQSVRQRRYRMCFTHGDLSPNNILVDDQFRPVGLVDWHCAAWMPEYWDFTTAMWRRQRYLPWFNAFKSVFPQYEDELAIEMELWKTICPF